MKVRFYLDNKPSKSKERTIWCYVREYSDTLTLNTGQRISQELWDKENQRANLRKTKDTILKGALKSINLYLNAFENKVFEIERAVRIKQFNAGFSLIADELRNQFNKRETSFYSIYDEFIAARRLQVSKQSLMKFKRVRDLVFEYQKNLTFEKITPLFFEKFYSFLIESKGMLNNTANKNIQFFKSFLIWANTNGFTDNTSYQSFKGKTEQNEVIFLSEEELMTLYNMQLENERLERVRDLFVFQCFTGVRYSDIQNIAREDIVGPTWKLRTQKTRQALEIPLNKFAISILAKYKELPQPLPVISNQKQNKYIKELCKLAKINEVVKTIQYKGKERKENVNKKYEIIGTHTARRTFISLSLRKGMKPDVIMAITGHSTYRMMQRYLKIADEHKREEMDKVWGSPLRLSNG
jgi:integrase